MSHIIGKVYEVNQKNMQKLIEELEDAQARIDKLETRLAILQGQWRNDVAALEDIAKQLSDRLSRM